MNPGESGGTPAPRVALIVASGWQLWLALLGYGAFAWRTFGDAA